MADKHMFDNDDVFTKDGNIDSTVTLDKSETLATQGNVINSLKIFWARLKAKLVHAITRTDTTKAVGTEYRPVYVDINGEVKPCNGLEKTVTNISSNNINIGNISPIIGTTLYIKVNTSSTSNNSLKINDKKVLYPTGVDVTANISTNTNLLVVYNGEFWILINKMNEVKSSGKTSESGAGSNGYSGLMTADDKAKLNTIEWGANKYSITAATSTSLGGVLSTTTGTTNNRYYNVQVNPDGTMKVNVPWTDTITSNWTANLKVGTANSISNDDTTGDDDTYIKVVENGAVHGNVKVVGSGDTTISSNNNGELVISSPTVPSYNILNNNNSDSSTPYLIKGAGVGKINTSYFLAGNGTWVKVTSVPNPPTGIDSDKTLKCSPNGTIYWG